MFENASDRTKGAFNLIAIIATINGVLIQMIMASRVLYGLAKQGAIAKQFAYINPKTRTPTVATAIIITIILILALFLPIERLAQMTSQIVLIIFMLVNLALILIKLKKTPSENEFYEVSIIVPVLGLISSFVLTLTFLL